MRKSVLVVILFVICSIAFSSEVMTGLVQKYDARYPGSMPYETWVPIDPYGADGVLSAVGTGSLMPKYIANIGGGGYEFSYALDTSNSANDTGGVINLGDAFIPDYRSEERRVGKERR